MALFLQRYKQFPLEKRLCAPEIVQGDLIYFANVPSPFFEETGINMTYLSRVLERGLVVKKFQSDTLFKSWKEHLIPYEQILDLSLYFPFAPDGRIFHIYLESLK